jgi:hypothetical protein
MENILKWFMVSKWKCGDMSTLSFLLGTKCFSKPRVRRWEIPIVTCLHGSSKFQAESPSCPRLLIFGFLRPRKVLYPSKPQPISKPHFSLVAWVHKVSVVAWESKVNHIICVRLCNRAWRAWACPLCSVFLGGVYICLVSRALVDECVLALWWTRI